MTRTTMSRSVTMPTSRSSSTTGVEPMSRVAHFASDFQDWCIGPDEAHVGRHDVLNSWRESSAIASSPRCWAFAAARAPRSWHTRCKPRREEGPDEHDAERALHARVRRRAVSRVARHVRRRAATPRGCRWRAAFDLLASRTRRRSLVGACLAAPLRSRAPCRSCRHPRAACRADSARRAQSAARARPDSGGSPAAR